ncbi:MAG: hypothetical protein LBL48_10690, partial [Azoarcus sp.]|nr:hypothetical protein [Azoarcus sp.]
PATPASSTSRNHNNNLIALHATAPDGQSVATTNAFYNYRHTPEPDRSRAHIYFFTDRSLYRPGQTIQFKAVAMRANPALADYKLLANHNLTIAIEDPNGKEAGKLKLTTNDYGSVSGSFTIPAGRLNGTYALHTTGPENGLGYIRVEEYKRPKFEVTRPAPPTAPQLNPPGPHAGCTAADLNRCAFNWKMRPSSSASAGFARHARPFLFLLYDESAGTTEPAEPPESALPRAVPRVVYAGADGRYGGANPLDPCLASDSADGRDDVVICF